MNRWTVDRLLLVSLHIPSCTFFQVKEVQEAFTPPGKSYRWQAGALLALQVGLFETEQRWWVLLANPLHFGQISSP